MNELIENIINNNIIKDNNYYGYKFNYKGIEEINKLGYKLIFTDSGIGYKKYN